MAPHSSTLAWKIPWVEEPGRLQSLGLIRVGYDWATSLSLFTFMHWRRKWQPTPVFLPGESQGWGSLVGCRLWGRTRLKWLSKGNYQGFPGGVSGICLQCRRHRSRRFYPCVGKVPWRRIPWRGAWRATWQATVHRVAKSWTRLKQFSTHGCNGICHLPLWRLNLFCWSLTHPEGSSRWRMRHFVLQENWWNRSLDSQISWS